MDKSVLNSKRMEYENGRKAAIERQQALQNELQAVNQRIIALSGAIEAIDELLFLDEHSTPAEEHKA